jgi:hypothetical protein
MAAGFACDATDGGDGVATFLLVPGGGCTNWHWRKAERLLVDAGHRYSR